MDSKKSYTTLPEGYQETFRVDLKKNKKQMILVSVISLILIIVMLIPLPSRYFINQIAESLKDGSYLYKCLVLLIGSVVYIILHELVHGVFMKKFSGVKPHYGFNIMYAFAGCDAYFTKVPYLIITLSPIVLLGIVLLVLNFLVPVNWGFVVYFIQMFNVSGAAGDLYVTTVLSRKPADILMFDTGLTMTAFTK